MKYPLYIYFLQESEDTEPKLTYTRVTNDLKNILSKDCASCMAVHSKVRRPVLAVWLFIVR